MPRGTQTNGELLRTHDAHGELWTCSENGELVRARNVSVNHSADAHGELYMAHDVSHEDMARNVSHEDMACDVSHEDMARDVSHEDMAMCGELLVAHDVRATLHGDCREPARWGRSSAG